MCRRILCIDPGKTTGYAMFMLDDIKHEAELITVAQATGISWLTTLNLVTTDIVIYESYFVRGPQFDTSGVEVIGAVRYAALLSDTRCIRQEPSVPNYIRNRLFHEHQPRMPPHGRDAFYHGLYYIQQLGWNRAVREVCNATCNRKTDSRN